MTDTKKELLMLTVFVYGNCFGAFWHRSQANVIDKTLPDPESMNQSLIVHLNYSPTQIKTPLMLPDNFFSALPVREWQRRTSGFLYNKRYMIGFSFVLGGYCLACNYCVQANKYLEKTDTWALWCSDIPIEIFIASSQQEMAKELILEIQRRYSNSQNPTDFISPLISFIQAIDIEITTLKAYLDAYRLIKAMHLQVALPINQKLFESLDERYKKTVHLKNIFLVWAAEYKINHNKAKHYMPAYT